MLPSIALEEDLIRKQEGLRGMRQNKYIVMQSAWGLCMENSITSDE